MPAADPINVLLVEDNPADARLLVESLREAGPDLFRVTRAVRLNEALTLLARPQAAAFDVVLLDLSLPDSSGLETVTRVRATAPRVPLVVLTGLQDESLALQAVRKGVQDYLVKGQCEGGLAARAVRYAVERSHVRGELQDREARLRAIVDTAADAILTIDERGVIESANPAAERMFGYRRDEMIGKNVRTLMPEPYAAEHDGYIHRYLNTGIAHVIGIGREVFGRRKDGSTFPHNLSISEFELNGRRMFAGVMHDMTERRRLEQEVLEASVNEQRRIGQDLHDGLCQEMLGISFGVEVLTKRLESVAPEEAERARRLGDHLEAALAQARALAHGLNPVDFQAGGLSEALNALAEKVSGMFHIQCRFRTKGGKVPLNDIAATHLYRIVQESVTNAIRHGRAKAIEVMLASSARGSMVLTVKDDGIGIGKAVNPGGHGMQIMKYRARLINASLDVSAARDGGTTVTCATAAGMPVSPTVHAPSSVAKEARNPPATKRAAKSRKGRK
jgi:two-component system sensor kinase FixL